MIEECRLKDDAAYNIRNYVKDMGHVSREEAREALEEYAGYQKEPENDWRYQ